MAAKDGVQGRRRLRIFAAAVALVLLCAVCVGGVSGADLYVGNTASTESNWYTSLADAVDAAGSGDTIIITENYVINDQVILSSENIGTNRNPIYATRDITITNAPGVDVIVSSGFAPLTSGNNDEVDTRTLFVINAGTLTLTANPAGGTLTFTTGHNGRAFDVNYDGARFNGGDGLGATLKMEDGVWIYQCGFDDKSLASTNNGGAVYVRTGGKFEMTGGRISENYAGSGGGVYLEESWSWWAQNGNGKFEMSGGIITGNHAINVAQGDDWGGGVWASDIDDFTWNYGGVIEGNTAEGIPNSANQKDYNEVYPSYNPPVAPETPDTPDTPTVIYPIYVKSATKTYDGYKTVKQAYDDARRQGETTFTIYIRENFIQGYIDTPENGVLVKVLDTVTITDESTDITVTVMPDGKSITLDLVDKLFTVGAHGSLIVSGNGDADITVTETFNMEGGDNNGGFVLVNGGSFTLQTGATLSSLKAENGGAVYVNSGTCTLAGGSITGCSASVHGDAVYVHDGTLIVDNSFTIPAENDIYLADGQVITVTSNYQGTIGKITLSGYSEGRNVIDISANTAVSSAKFVLNPADANQYEDMLLKVSDSENGKIYLELGVDVQFTILIPAALELDGDTYTGSMKITAEKVLIPKDDVLQVTVTSPNDGFILIHYKDAEITLPYTLSVGSPDTPLGADGEIARFTKDAYQEKQAQNAELAVELYARLSAEPRYAGDYTDTLTFTVTYIDG
ncbi:MAG: hypothetical protein E7Z72_04195 [Methanocorpusculum parvum]|nr:hypothetical protein [Methanocorpusculum parvum]